MSRPLRTHRNRNVENFLQPSSNVISKTDSSSGAASKPADANSQQPIVNILWLCCHCKNSASSTCIDHCPECQHLRCLYCFAELGYDKYEAFTIATEKQRYIPNQNSISTWPYNYGMEESPNFSISQKITVGFRRPYITCGDGEERLPLLAGECEQLEVFNTDSSTNNRNENYYASQEGMSPQITHPSDSSITSITGNPPIDHQEVEKCSDKDIEGSSAWEDIIFDSNTTLDTSSKDLAVLDSCFLSIHTLPRAYVTSLIAQIHAVFYLRNRTGQSSSNTTTPDNQQTHANSSTSSTRSIAAKVSSLQKDGQKRPRESNDPDEGDKQPKRGRANNKPPPINGDRMFACHFRKKDPEKYNPWNHPRYQACVFPGYHYNRLRDIKTHFKAVHCRPQCPHCHQFFDNTDLLATHQEEFPCNKEPLVLKEDINQNKKDEIDLVLRAKSDMGTTPDQKWYDIWKILNPEMPPPSDPWNEQEKYQLQSTLPSIDDLLYAFDQNVENMIREGRLPSRHNFRSEYRDIVDQTFQMMVAPSIESSTGIVAVDMATTARVAENTLEQQLFASDNFALEVPPMDQSLGTDFSPEDPPTAEYFRDTTSEFESLDHILDIDHLFDNSFDENFEANSEEHPLERVDWTNFGSYAGPYDMSTILQTELELPTAGIPHETKADRNKGLQGKGKYMS